MSLVSHLCELLSYSWPCLARKHCSTTGSYSANSTSGTKWNTYRSKLTVCCIQTSKQNTLIYKINLGGLGEAAFFSKLSFNSPALQKSVKVVILYLSILKVVWSLVKILLPDSSPLKSLKIPTEKKFLRSYDWLLRNSTRNGRNARNTENIEHSFLISCTLRTGSSPAVECWALYPQEHATLGHTE